MDKLEFFPFDRSQLTFPALRIDLTKIISFNFSSAREHQSAEIIKHDQRNYKREKKYLRENIYIKFGWYNLQRPGCQ